MKTNSLASYRFYPHGIGMPAKSPKLPGSFGAGIYLIGVGISLVLSSIGGALGRFQYWHFRQWMSEQCPYNREMILTTWFFSLFCSLVAGMVVRCIVSFIWHV